ncbi:hypothetical protein EDD22DRAFT_960761 [Suillus occidentalis]|nr:hypothetical protein EDD22DRAFT_960761 [Suillus occidentalis]
MHTLLVGSSFASEHDVEVKIEDDAGALRQDRYSLRTPSMAWAPANAAQVIMTEGNSSRKVGLNFAFKGVDIAALSYMGKSNALGGMNIGVGNVSAEMRNKSVNSLALISSTSLTDTFSSLIDDTLLVAAIIPALTETPDHTTKLETNCTDVQGCKRMQWYHSSQPSPNISSAKRRAERTPGPSAFCGASLNAEGTVLQSASPASFQTARLSSPMRSKFPGIAVPLAMVGISGLAAPSSPVGLRPEGMLPSRFEPPKHLPDVP